MIWPDDLKDQILSSAAPASSRMLSEKLTTNPKPNLTVIGISEESDQSFLKSWSILELTSTQL